jgi:hypothetical protein
VTVLKEDHLSAVLVANQQENVSIEYKASNTLEFSDNRPLDRKGNSQKTLGHKHREEFILDVAAMANAEGGKIYIGIEADKDGFPKGLDEGFDASNLNADGLEQILLSNIHPPLERLSIHAIERQTGKFAFLIEVAKAARNAPHQTPDHRYHKRNERTRHAMSDAGIRDAMKRSIDHGRQFGAAWNLSVEVSRLGSAIKEREAHDRGHSAPRSRLTISVSDALRSAGNAMILLPKDIRCQAASLVAAIDAYNSIIETVDPGQQEKARISEPLRSRLSDMMKLSRQIANAVGEIIDKEP